MWQSIIDFIMGITFQHITFAVLAVIVIGSALMVVILRNIFHSLLFLTLCFIGIAGIYLLLSADFIAAVHVLIYIGAVSVLMMFALMLTNRVMRNDLRQMTHQVWIAIPVTVCILVIMVRVFVFYHWGYSPKPPSTTTGVIGKSLLTDYLLPFELASLLLLAAMIGAIVIAKEDKPDDPA